MRPPSRALLVLLLAWAGPSLFGGPRRAGAQDLLTVIDVLAAQVESRADTLSDSSDLNLDAVQSLTYELAAHVDRLADACAPIEVLAAVVPDVRITVAALAQAASFGSIIDVESNAQVLLSQMEVLRGRVRNLRAGP